MLNHSSDDLHGAYAICVYYSKKQANLYLQKVSPSATTTLFLITSIKSLFPVLAVSVRLLAGYAHANIDLPPLSARRTA